MRMDPLGEGLLKAGVESSGDLAGLAGSHPVRAQIISKLQQQVDTTGWPRLKRPQAPLPLKAYIRAICIFSGSLCLVWKKECSQKKKRGSILHTTQRQNGNPA